MENMGKRIFFQKAGEVRFAFRINAFLSYYCWAKAKNCGNGFSNAVDYKKGCGKMVERKRTR